MEVWREGGEEGGERDGGREGGGDGSTEVIKKQVMSEQMNLACHVIWPVINCLPCLYVRIPCCVCLYVEEAEGGDWRATHLICGLLQDGLCLLFSCFFLAPLFPKIEGISGPH